MTPLAARLARRIADTGPMSVADYMAACLTDPTDGYYVTRDPLGVAGDFVTAPEVSQMFGELLGLCLAQAWIDQGQPSEFALVELGPGRGTLMADALRATKGIAGFHAAAQLHLVEASPVLRAAQAAALTGAVFHDMVATLPQMPLFLIANEFFDALPIRQFQRITDGWVERLVTTDGDAFAFTQSAPLPVPELADRDDVVEGQIVELCPALSPTVGAIAQRLDHHGGAAVIIDYGDWASLGDTLQAVRAHEAVDPLSGPGSADLTAHVDFAAMAAAASPARFTRLTPQGVFLERLGVTERARQLAAGLAGEPLESHIAAHRRLTHPAEMGDLFKVIGLYPADAAPPPGLTP